MLAVNMDLLAIDRVHVGPLACTAGSNRKPKFLRGLFLRAIHRDKAVDFLGGVKPEGCAKVRKVQRSRSAHRRQDVGLTKIQRQIAQYEETRILLQSVEARLESFRRQRAVACQPNQVSSGLEHQKDA